jgi:hypothetical protein
MAKQEESGNYRSVDGRAYTDEHEAIRADNRAYSRAGGGGVGGGFGSFLDMAGKFIILLPLLGILAMFFLILIAFFKGYIILCTRLPLFAVAGIIGLPAAIYAFLKMRGLGKRIFAFIFSWLIVAAPLSWGAYLIYGRTSKHFSTMYSADYIQVLPDGSAPKLYEKRHQRGKVLAELGIDEYVTVNGITINSAEYNITTASGLTGWVSRKAFPEDAAEMLGIMIELGGFDQEQVQTDRYTVRLMQKYMDEEPIRWTLGGKEVLEYGYKISQNTLNRSIRVNAQTPLLYLTSAEYKEGGELKDTGVKVTLANILYSDDCTLIYVTAPLSSDYNTWPHGAKGNTNAWRNGLIVTDLATGEIYKAMRADYYKTHHRIGSETETNVFFFPPFKTRHFSLTREALPMPPPKEIKEGYGGILSWIDDIGAGKSGSSKGAVSYTHWEFPEIRVR